MRWLAPQDLDRGGMKGANPHLLSTSPTSFHRPRISLAALFVKVTAAAGRGKPASSDQVGDTGVRTRVCRCSAGKDK